MTPSFAWDRPLSLVMRANQEAKLSELKLRRQVRAARRHGHSWAAIGFALGVTKQAAQQRFGPFCGGSSAR